MTAIEIENISKQYALGKIGSGTLYRDLNVWWARMRGKPNPYLKIGQVNDRTQKADGDYVWALQNINFKIEEGEVVGIIGSNGAGKSTLLKILSRVTTPTTGRITTYGRIASLLEVGTGFHQEMTGRENIYMNGAIMGMTKHDIDRKLDEIVDFAGVEKYIDTPVKRYSSGMTVRLGFAVAAFLEPEILVVDEVLTVGDAEFQKKAIGKMNDVAHESGRTVLFVSHNMAAVRNLCTRGVVLKNGTLVFDGLTTEAVDYYLDNNITNLVSHSIIGKGNRTKSECDTPHDIEFKEVWLLNENVDSIATDECLRIKILMARNNGKKSACQYSVIITDVTDVKILNIVSNIVKIPQGKDKYFVNLTLSNLGLPQGRYKIQLAAGIKEFDKANVNFDVVFDVLSFEIKYLNSSLKNEYCAWNRSWGIILHNKECINAVVY